MSKAYLLGIVGGIALLTAGGVAGSNLQHTAGSNPQQPIASNQQQDDDKNSYPIAVYNPSEPTGKSLQDLHEVRGSRYDRPGAEPIQEGVEELPVIGHWWVGMPALPKAESDAVVVGEIINAEAYLSNNRTSIHSEFTISVEEVLKDAHSTSSSSSRTLVAERAGGAVKFPSGRIQVYSIHKQGMPRVGRRYLFFLKYNEKGQDFSILTGYELRGGWVTPLDCIDQQPFADYKGRAEGDFLHEVRELQEKPVQSLPHKGEQNQ